jgi:acyl-CoA synthetase (AMP-forming)/AMP-acid ligase II
MILSELLDETLARSPTATALLAPSRTPLSYDALRQQIALTAGTLRLATVGKEDTVAVALPNGPEMAAAVVAVASGAVCAPLNPNYGVDEFRFFLGNLGAKALLLPADEVGPARVVAEELGVRCLDVHWHRDAPAGRFELTGFEGSTTLESGTAPCAGDAALYLHTSGTTARPKFVPLSHANLCNSALNVARGLQLSAEDRCLGIMPLFHVHGIVAALLGSLAAGGSVACTPGYHHGQFLPWLEELHPTWITAVPTMYEAILAELAHHPTDAAANRLRFARSSSAPLPPAVMRDLEQALQAPVIEAYGMTEASHQIASNPLPPGVRKPKSAGVAAGTEVAVMDAGARLLPPGATGEIVIRGDNVIRGYEGSPEANATAFAAGWFRTGDQGHIDADGYVFLTGRLKEIINRGGEMVSPPEVDEALLEHAAVAHAVAFGVRHETLGEDVAAAVVLKPGANATEAEIRAFLFGRLAEPKIPSRLVIVDTIPSGATGKIQRSGLEAKLAKRMKPAFVAPRDAVEAQVAGIFAQVLGTREVGAFDNFFALGGDSLRGTQALARVRERLHADLSILDLFKDPTVAQLALQVERRRQVAARVALAQILAEVDLMSDEEAGRRLQQPHGDGNGHRN